MCVGSSAWGWSGRLREKGGHLLLPPHPLTALPRHCCEYTLVYKKVTRFCLAHHLWTSLYILTVKMMIKKIETKILHILKNWSLHAL